jgi:two-component system CheB/CheR fusion protein
VGIGASAGGLEALVLLLRNLHLDNVAFVVVQHLSPTQQSMLGDILDNRSQLRVHTAADGSPLERNRIFVAPPNAELGIRGDKLVLTSPPAGARAPMPIDAFFRSLAEARGAHAIGVILSGTGTDGTLGLGAIKAAGGITIVQEPASAKFDGMPRSAIDAGHADFVLPPERIVGEIMRISKLPYLNRERPVDPPSEEAFTKIAGLVKAAFGLDLTQYKPNTIERRIQRRMAVHRLDRISDYVALCKSDDRELSNLHKDLLINVTGFFRDRDPWIALKDVIIPRILDQLQCGEVVRVWVPGCASGEEAYSIAICLLEVLEERDPNVRVQVFGTDLDPEAVQQARRGVYPATISADVSPERLRRFFTRTDDDRYQIARAVRDLVVFSVQNIAKDAPFSRLDLVSCRNLLIYLQPSVQRRILRILHYALAPRGFLMLGTSESIGDSVDLFTLVDRKEKIYAAKHLPIGQWVLDLGGARHLPPAQETARPSGMRPVISLAHLADRKILEQYAPAGVVLSENLDILHYRGRTAGYLEQSSGVATHNVLRLIRPELHHVLKELTEKSLSQNERVHVEAHVREGEDGGFRPITLIAQPLLDPETKARCLLVLFKEADQPGPQPASAETSTGPTDQARILAQELALTKDYLHGTIEELERANEDLKSANEELQSSNEELQSTNEELETSKEELQSTNEELITLNEELQNRMRDLNVANNDLHNLLVSVDRAVVLVGLDLRVRRFTLAAERLLDLASADIGRSIGLLNGFLGSPEVGKLVATVIESITTIERELDGPDQRRYLVRVAPYKTLELSERGAVVTIIDITPQRDR